MHLVLCKFKFNKLFSLTACYVKATACLMTREIKIYISHALGLTFIVIMFNWPNRRSRDNHLKPGTAEQSEPDKDASEFIRKMKSSFAASIASLHLLRDECFAETNEWQMRLCRRHSAKEWKWDCPRLKATYWIISTLMAIKYFFNEIKLLTMFLVENW